MIGGKKVALTAGVDVPVGYHRNYYFATDTACTLTLTNPIGGTNTLDMVTGEQYIYDGPAVSISSSVDCNVSVLYEG